MKSATLPDTASRRRRYRNYVTIHRWRPAVSRRFTKAGVIVLLALVAAGVQGVDTSLSMAYQAFTLLLFLVVLAVVGTRFSRVRFQAQRKLPRFGSAGQPLSYHVTIRNLSRRRQEGLVLFEDLEPALPGYAEYLRTPEPEERQRNWLDRHYGYYRWMWLVEQRDQGRLPAQTLPALPPGGEGEVRCEFTPKRRGVLRFTGVTLGCPEPFNLFRSLKPAALPQNVLILPRRYPLPSFALPGSMKYQQGGVALAASVGESEEFVSLRDYRPGDPLRHIHWKSWARTGRPIVKEFQEEFFMRHALVLDTFTDRAFSPEFEEAVSVAASFAATVDTQDTLLDLMFVGSQAYCFTVGRGVAHTEQMLEILAGVEVCLDRPFNSLSELVLEHVAAVSGCICVLLSWDEARQDFVRRLDAMGIPLLVLVVTGAGAPKLDPGPLRNQAGRFHQLEPGRVAEQLARLR